MIVKAYMSVRKAQDAPGLAEALGDMLFAWSWAERQLVGCFAVILGTSNYKASRLYQKLPNFRSRIQAMLVLIELHPEFEPIKPYILKLSSLSKTRNDWVHGAFIRGQNEIRAINLDEGLESKRRSKPLKPGDIVNHSDAVRARTDELQKAMIQVPAFAVYAAAQIEERKKGAGPLDKRPEAPPQPREN